MTARYLTVEDVAALLRCSKRSVQSMVAQGTLPHVRLAGTRRVLFPADELQQALGGAPLERIDLARGGRLVRVKAAR